MRLATIRHDGSTTAALIGDDDDAVLLQFPDALHAIRAHLASPGSLAGSTTVAHGDYEVLAPIPRPGKIFGSGINYASHKEENPAAVMPVEPGFFSKFPSSVTGPGTDVILPTPESQVDYEVELAIVIGKPGRNISQADAPDHVFGYTVINDVSGRDVQFRANQMDLGKGFDTFCPMGPWVVSADEVPDVNDVMVRSFINGELRQDTTTREWLYTVPALIEHASRHLTLETGDLITTGTPAGCGTFRTPPLWLRDGDEMVVEAVGIGRLANRVVKGW